ncbi:hypothetical protein GCM10017044_05460 [Kordiimonas sediminis]|uniref:Uncharacterized protein n=1 Tax=Kordiimonas sediminis TaxID=1735581 RepID=A0A919ALJ8_9PROT|nr:lysylphosphatidylglycerol synthase domain-containing protein [Kordiimonas sediminis]GHF14275.1 hypothetical protein GCM10017044_05460 [Kordiimonas sediminis]
MIDMKNAALALQHFKESRFYALLQTRTARFTILGIALVLFSGGLYFSVQSYPVSLTDLNVSTLLFITLVLMPLIMIFNALEFMVSAPALDAHPDFKASFKTITIGSAINMLPMPGTTLAKLTKLKSMGVSLRQGTLMTMLISLNWLLISGVFAGICLLLLDLKVYGIVVGAVSFTALIGLITISVPYWGGMRRCLKVLGVRLVLVLLAAAQTYLSFKAIGSLSSPAEASLISISWIFGSAASVVPAGLGVSEAISALIAIAIQTSPATAFLAISLTRILNMVTVLPVAAFLWMPNTKKT